MKNIDALLSAFGLPSSSIETKVIVNAILIIRGSECYLVPGNTNYESPDRIELYYPNLKTLLDEAVGGWVGGLASYYDNVVITGVLKKGATTLNPLSISKIEKCKIIRDGETYEVIS
ncbi:hypothetical protein [Cronobacter turicensis]|uniref:hypothetical protein n=1 Tax=Cronobacter turicensis TaxID=413502 RepID=UPI0024AFF621|nr:hypothetical protein [Cronobacter turicensis]MDI7419694.1 hypothetical protein [Cronobacter turicensis]MDI7495603.1 hypothetical protein [Cronobacter turicensis]